MTPNDNTSIKAQLNIYIYEFDEDAVPVNTITLSSKTVDEGYTGTVAFTVSPPDATNKGLTWSSSNTFVVSVNADTGVITALTAGSAMITATAKDGSGVSGTCTVTVNAFVSGARVRITASEGWLETAYVKWDEFTGAASYDVYYKGGSVSSYTKIDDPLVRKYQLTGGQTYYRADVLGIAAGSYDIKVVPVVAGTARDGNASETSVSVTAHDRSGFAFSSNSPFKSSSGAYTNTGVLAAGAQVIYVTAQNAKTVTHSVITSAKGAVTNAVGIGEIVAARQKGYDKTPLAIRFIGKLTASDMAGQINSLSLLEVKGKSAHYECNVTIEGVGDDATTFGWGVLVRNGGNVEVRNMGFMQFPDDGVSLDTDNHNIWVHNNDFFYGKNGGGDKNKGDGSLDSKKSGWTTFSYNHFYDSGKCNLLGNGTETPEYLTYHHNWYDHSDSRHPRVRFHTVHVYNNYYDGVAKYGIGAAKGGPSIFSEAKRLKVPP
ncbi:hypothetical protein FACS189473_5460 [Spirochaetia bacterium]|nr:hypothetical protein FACS189473_5460 [Spirochaetia bacterium]